MDRVGAISIACLLFYTLSPTNWQGKLEVTLERPGEGAAVRCRQMGVPPTADLFTRLQIALCRRSMIWIRRELIARTQMETGK